MSRLVFFIIIIFSANSFAYTLLPAKQHSTISGYTRAVSSMTVTAETAGRLVGVSLGMGDVSDGSPFAVIDPYFTNLSIASVDNSIKRIDANLRKLDNSINYLQKEFNRVESLYLSEVETESRRDGAKQSLDQAMLSRDELTLERQSLEISLKELREKLRRQYIRVPAGWSITSKPLEVGELVAAGSVIAYAADFRELVVPIYIDNAQTKYLTAINEVEVTVSGEKHMATLKRVNPAYDETTRKRQAEISIKMQGVGGLLVKIPVVTDAEGLMVDSRAVNERYANPRVVANGREIKVNITGRDGDMIILAPSEELRAGMELEAVR